MWKRLHVKYQVFLSDFNETWIFSADFRKNTQASNFMKIGPVGVELFHTNGYDEVKSLFAILRAHMKWSQEEKQ